MINVLSLFDGIGTAKLALDRSGIGVGRYFASETDATAMQIAKTNHAGITEVGDARRIACVGNGIAGENGFEDGHVDLILGGNNFADGYDRALGYKCKDGVFRQVDNLDEYLRLKGLGIEFVGEAYLFWEFVRILRTSTARYFLFENTKLDTALREIVSRELGVEPISINAALVSAQNRDRLYWTNIPVSGLPENRNVTLFNILDEEAENTDVSNSEIIKKSYVKMLDKYGYVPEAFNAYNATEFTSADKAPTLSRGSMVTSSCAVTVYVPCDGGKHVANDGILNRIWPTKLPNGRYNLRRLSIKEMERLQTLPEGYVDFCETSLSKKGQLIGSAWTADVIAHILKGIEA